MAAVVGIVSIGMALALMHENNLIRAKQVLYKLLLHFNSHLKQLYIREHFSYKDGSGMHGHYAHIEVCKGRAGYRYMGFSY